jgi:hypothetical protein
LEFFQKTEKAATASAASASATRDAGSQLGPGLQLVDAETGSTWNFEGRTVAGPLAGRQLKKVFVLEDYWFDWRIYHPDTRVYDIGPR